MRKIVSGSDMTAGPDRSISGRKNLTLRRKSLYLQDNFDNLVIFVLFRAQEIWPAQPFFLNIQALWVFTRTKYSQQ